MNTLDKEIEEQAFRLADDERAKFIGYMREKCGDLRFNSIHLGNEDFAIDFVLVQIAHAFRARQQKLHIRRITNQIVQSTMEALNATKKK